MSTEQKFFQALRRSAPSWLTLTRIETAATATGVADVDYVAFMPDQMGFRHAAGYIELKVAKPARGGGYRLGHILTWPQLRWLVAHTSATRPGRFASYVAIGIYARGSSRLDSFVWLAAHQATSIVEQEVIHPAPRHIYGLSRSVWTTLLL